LPIRGEVRRSLNKQLVRDFCKVPISIEPTVQEEEGDEEKKRKQRKKIEQTDRIQAVVLECDVFRFFGSVPQSEKKELGHDPGSHKTRLSSQATPPLYLLTNQIFLELLGEFELLELLGPFS